MTLFCPGCNTAIDGAAAIGIREMHCPNCGIRFAVPAQAASGSADAARWGEVTTAKLAVVSLLAGLASLVLPFCLCPFLLLGVSAGGGRPPAPIRTRAVTIPTPADPSFEEEIVEEGEESAEEGDDFDDDESAGGSGGK